MQNKRVRILHAGIDAFTHKEALDKIRLFLSSSGGHQVVTLNSEMAVRSEEDAQFRDIINSADLSVPDGMGILCAASFLKRKKNRFFSDCVSMLLTPFYAILSPEKITEVLPEKISGIDLIHAICASDFSKGKRIYLVGARSGVALKAGEALKRKYPQIEIVGAEEGILKNFSEEENERLVGRINSQIPDIIFVALGAPRQEKWISENLNKIPSVRVAMGVGGSFDVISGNIRRAPGFFQAHNLEWFWRLLLEPKRLGRIYNASFRFCWLIFRSRKDKI